jgi:hypothetical protein
MPSKQLQGHLTKNDVDAINYIADKKIDKRLGTEITVKKLLTGHREAK